MSADSQKARYVLFHMQTSETKPGGPWSPGVPVEKNTVFTWFALFTIIFKRHEKHKWSFYSWCVFLVWVLLMYTWYPCISRRPWGSPSSRQTNRTLISLNLNEGETYRMHAYKERHRLIFSQGLVLKLPRIPLTPSGPGAPLKNKIYDMMHY